MTDDDRWLGHLQRDEPPPPGLRRRIQADLRARGLLARRGPGPGLRLLATAAAATILFLAGFAAGRRGPLPAVGAGPRFALLLYEPPGFDSTTPEPRMVAEYRSWARGLGRERLALGEKLSQDQRVLDPTHGSGTAVAGPAGPLAGLFIIHARNWDEAMTIARTCPHLKHGGVVAVKRVEET